MIRIGNYPRPSMVDLPFGVPPDKPPRKRRNEAEFRLHCFVADLLRKTAHPHVVWFHPANGEHRSEATGARLKRMGVIPGTPDFVFVLSGGQAAFLELKAIGGRLSDSQVAFRDRVEALGCRYAVVKTGDEAVAVLRAWGVIRV